MLKNCAIVMLYRIFYIKTVCVMEQHPMTAASPVYRTCITMFSAGNRGGEIIKINVPELCVFISFDPCIDREVEIAVLNVAEIID